MLNPMCHEGIFISGRGTQILKGEHSWAPSLNTRQIRETKMVKGRFALAGSELLVGLKAARPSKKKGKRGENHTTGGRW